MPGVPGDLSDEIRERSLDLHLKSYPVDKKVQAVSFGNRKLPLKRDPVLPEDLFKSVLKVFLRGKPKPKTGKRGNEVRGCQFWLLGIRADSEVF